jgi:hypothetical protein
MGSHPRDELQVVQPLDLGLCFGPDPDVEREPPAPPGEKAFRPFGAEEFPLIGLNMIPPDVESEFRGYIGRKMSLAALRIFGPRSDG